MEAHDAAPALILESPPPLPGRHHRTSFFHEFHSWQHSIAPFGANRKRSLKCPHEVAEARDVVGAARRDRQRRGGMGLGDVRSRLFASLAHRLEGASEWK